MSNKNNILKFPKIEKMELRDYFASVALEGVIAQGWTSDYDMHRRANWCYAMADAMLDARDSGDPWENYANARC